MKHIIKLSDLIGSEIRTRFSLDALKAKLNENDEYLVDTNGKLYKLTFKGVV